MFLLMFNLVIYFILTGLKKNKEDNIYGIQPLLAILAMWLTQDIVLRLFFSKKIIEGKDFLNLKSSEENSYWIKREKNIGTMNKQF